MLIWIINETEARVIYIQNQSTIIKFQNISLLFTITFIYLKEKDIVRAGIQE